MLGVMKRVVLLSFFFLLPVVAASPEPPDEMRVTEAIVFKNGLSFVTREGALAQAAEADARFRSGTPRGGC